jgi:S-adenosylmethionine:tRNA ribosyltransferase-isomerase
VLEDPRRTGDPSPAFFAESETINFCWKQNKFLCWKRLPKDPQTGTFPPSMSTPISLLDLTYDYPENLVAQSPQNPPRVMWVQNQIPQEISFAELIEKIPAGDVLVVNDTKVLKRRVFAGNLEILFLSHSSDRLEWEVLFPSKSLKVGSEIELPLGRRMTLIEKGRPQKVRADQALNESYFEEVAELPLPPYIQKARGERHNITSDEKWYQTVWAEKPGSLAAPTASLHFKQNDLEKLKARGVQVETLTLHVGLGTFLPLTAETLEKGKLHFETVEIKPATWEKLLSAKREGRKIWALGTTVTRSLESAIRFQQLEFETDLFIQPGFEFKMVDVLMTNFHQPESSLLSLVMAFAGIEPVKKNYLWAIKNKFRLFSYGDFSIWMK